MFVYDSAVETASTQTKSAQREIKKQKRYLSWI